MKVLKKDIIKKGEYGFDLKLNLPKGYLVNGYNVDGTIHLVQIAKCKKCGKIMNCSKGHADLCYNCLEVKQ